jgi:hypothetical protein
MAIPTTLNSQITDSVTQTNTQVVGDSPAVSTSNLYIATSQALSNSAHNATTNQQNTATSQQASTNMGVANLYSVDTASTGRATNMIYG